MKTKECPKCKRNLSVKMFCKDRQQKNGLACYCRKCQKNRGFKYRSRPEVKKYISKYAQEYHKKNKKRIREQKRKYIARPEVKKRMKIHYKKWEQSEQGRKWRKEYLLKHKNRLQAYNAIHKALKKGKIIKPKTCEKCHLKRTLQSHHYKSYNKKYWFTVQWLCAKCHNKLNLK